MNIFNFSTIMYFILISTSFANKLNFDKPITYRHVQNFIKTFEIKSIQDFLKKLPSSYKKHHTLMHNSQSIQDASFLDPRVIMFGKNAQAIFTFNGKKEQNGYNAIETALFNSYTKKYEYREISFDPKGELIASVSQSTPSKCIRCHGIEQTPIWNHYNQWPGAYGSDDDTFTPEEYKNLNKFLKQAKKHPRYSQINELQEGYSFKNKVTFVRGTTASRSSYQHNRAFTAKLYNHHYQRIIKDIKSIKEYDYLKPAILALLSKCYLDKSNRDRSEGLPTTELILNSIFHHTLEGKSANHNSVIRPEYFLYYIFKKLNYSFDHWNPNEDRIKNPLLLNNGLQITSSSLIYYLIENDNEAKEYFDISEKIFIEQTLIPLAKIKKNKCGTLLSKAQGSMGQFIDDAKLNEKKGRKEKRKLKREKFRSLFKFKSKGAPVPKTCLRCHSSNKNEVTKIFLPFNSLKKKENQLVIHKILEMITPDKTGKAKMPINFLDKEDQKKYLKKDYPRFKRYLKSLLK
ncbi:hypothetical protein N9N67_03915 [Bacteriovoracaceae bacterium]|nr:hypothetical protein [Bacteriovoracaceae bacterium]